LPASASLPPALGAKVAAPRRRWLLPVPWALFLILGSLFLLSTSREPPWADAHVVYDTAQALVDRHALDITLDGPPQFFAHHHGKKYGVFPLGNVVAMVPSYLAFRLLLPTRLFPPQPLAVLCSHLSPALLMAGAAVVLYRLARRRGAGPRFAALLALSLGLSTVCFCYGRVAYSEALQALLLLLLCEATLRAGEAAVQGAPLRWLLPVQVGLYAGALLNSKLVNVLLLPLVPAYLLAVVFCAAQRQLVAAGQPSRLRAAGRTTWRLLGPFALALLSFAPLLALALWHNRLKTGSIWDTGYQINQGVFSGDLLPGLHGFLLAPGKNLFLHSPPLLLLLVPAALRTAWQRQRGSTALLGGLFLVGLLWNAKFRSWHGDYCWGPRHLVPFIPLALLLLVPWLPAALHRGRQRLRRWLLALLLASGLVVQLIGASFYWDHYIRMLIAIKDQTGASGWYQEQLGHAHYMPQFAPLRGHLWLLGHKLSGDSDLNRDAPWKLLVPQRVNLDQQFRDLRFDWWLLDFRHQPAYPLALPLLLCFLSGSLSLGLYALYRQLRDP
jgi:hypothetical protein